ncbi:putative casein kinase II regulatory subunit [Cryptosporidium canis]|uniref:Casein kinase II subunit beta n=1 Tax=Cryptosporidium canis TaxID=195482 RepID=A0ABQ8P5Z4_9CRYT|nr:putative casein kinase II regulatory subunit [Cryptosporidium canis]KAJ1614257.1 putative casein kinase II regulatory subunit [Cryptosporidium canis]
MGMNSDSDESENGWVHWYCGLREHYFFIVIPNEYTRDAFNLYGLRQYFPKNYDSLIELILSSNIPDEDDLADPALQDLHREAGELYGLIHARYITTPRGLQIMKHKYDKGCFGKCPRVLCNGHKVLPVGITNELRSRRVRVYCPNCQEAYDPRNVNLIDIDGAFFGTSFPHIFLQVYPEYVSTSCPEPYYPKIFGFRVSDKLSIIERKGINGEYGKRAQAEMFKARPSSLQHVEKPQQLSIGIGKLSSSVSDGSIANSSNQDNLNSRNSEYNSTASSKTMKSSNTSNMNLQAVNPDDIAMSQGNYSSLNSANKSGNYSRK